MTNPEKLEKNFMLWVPHNGPYSEEEVKSFAAYCLEEREKEERDNHKKAYDDFIEKTGQNIKDRDQQIMADQLRDLIGNGKIIIQNA